MQLTKVEISGFKSFAKRTELLFEKGITGILGPNGCGKSNIVDAFRFVLGEQSSRAMRGKKIEDFIFCGTEKRRPLSYCEVILTFDNSDGRLLSPFSEVSVARRAYRSGESEYLINKNPCRLKDILELFRDTGIGREGYSIIGQGRVSEILSDRSSERRAVFEEAAGIAKYRARKEEAERRLAAAQKNLVRLNDILSELETRLEPLRVQSETAAEYLKLRDELKDIEINLFIYQYDRSSEKIKSLNETAQQLDESIAQQTAAEASYAAGCNEAEAEERKLSAVISGLSQELVSLSTAVESVSGNEKLLNERINAFKQEIERRNEQKKQFEQSVNSNSDELTELEKTLKDASDKNATLSAELERITDSISQLENDIEEKEEQLEIREQAMMDEMNRISDARIRISRLETMRASLNERAETLAADKLAYSSEAQKLSDELNETNEALSSVRSEKAETEAKRREQINKVNSINSELLLAMRQARQKEDELNSIRSRVKVLSEMKRAHEGYYASVRRLLNDAERNTELKRRIHGVVAELISVPKEYEAAIEMSLGSALQDIIVSDEQDAKAVIKYLRDHDYGRATLLPVSSMRPRLLNSEESRMLRIDGCIGVASELISYSPEYRGVIENLLGRTVIVRDLDAGIALRRQAGSSFRIATLKGDILNPGGSMTGGSLQKREFSLLGREREIEESDRRENEIRNEIAAFAASLQSLKNRLAEANAGVDGFSDELKRLDVRKASLEEKADIVRKYVRKNAEQLEKAGQEACAVRDSLNDIAEEFAAAEKAKTGMDEHSGITSEDIKKMQNELSELRAQMQQKNEISANARIKLTAASKEYDAAAAQIRRIKKENETLKAKSAEETDKISLAESSIAGIEAERAELIKNLGSEREHFNQMNDEMHRLEEERAGKLRFLDELRSKHDETSALLTETRERRHKNELTADRLQSEIRNLSDRIWQDYELTYENALQYKKVIPIAQSHIRADEIRKAIKELGEVNPSAIEDYRNVKERYENLNTQCDDLKNAESDLQQLILQLTSTMQKEFKEQFVLIQENFSKTFTELFGGGRAELELADKNDVLGCDIDIIAQPPGKKFQLLSLLSGGEQALTAIALLFAILKLKPAAFCILDEIDTSLDEVNVENFANYLKQYSDETQFIVITHRNGSMAACDSLYGVSMEEKGVSSLVSVKFNGN